MKAKLLKYLSRFFYILGASIALTLIVVFIFGAHSVPYPLAMIPYTWREIAVLWLAFGTLPMLGACYALRKFGDLPEKLTPRRQFLLVFSPGFVCAACALLLLGLFIVGCIYTFQ
jgi:hypothetical protein